MDPAGIFLLIFQQFKMLLKQIDIIVFLSYCNYLINICVTTKKKQNVIFIFYVQGPLHGRLYGGAGLLDGSPRPQHWDPRGIPPLETEAGAPSPLTLCTHPPALLPGTSHTLHTST